MTCRGQRSSLGQSAPAVWFAINATSMQVFTCDATNICDKRVEVCA